MAVKKKKASTLPAWVTEPVEPVMTGGNAADEILFDGTLTETKMSDVTKKLQRLVGRRGRLKWIDDAN